ncbi:hypothetical protein [Nostoc sp.]|uniref:hypothetical protein n=1 Tax=Nostoc sp. TaxID=1180 RepID=UPI002FF2C28A
MFLLLDLFYHQEIARTAIAQGAVAEPIAPTPIHRRTISHSLAEFLLSALHSKDFES